MNIRIKLLAEIISQVFSPFLLLPLIFIFIIFKNYSSFPNQLAVFLKFLVFLILPIMGILFFLKKTNRISNFDMSIRKERYLFNILALIVVFVFLLFSKFLGLEKMTNYIWISFFGFLILAIITFFWKISGHTTSVTFFFLVLFHFSTNFVVIGVPVIFLVSWSRVFLQRHTVLQTIGGAILSLGTFYLATYFKLI